MPRPTPVSLVRKRLHGERIIPGIVLNAGLFDAYSKTGTTHGTWNPYDTHIPLLWYGWNIKHGATNREVYMTDISATLAALLHIQMPNGCIGKVIEDLTPALSGKAVEGNKPTH